jgi:hypothetical protein
MTNQRGNPRTPLKVKLKLDHPLHGEMLVVTRDISDCGVYVLMDQAQHLLKVGEEMQGQVQGLPMEAPILRMRVIRVEALGVGLRFLGE